MHDIQQIVQRKESPNSASPEFANGLLGSGASATGQADELRAVQAKGPLDGAHVQAAAQQGVAGAGGQLPHMDAIQASFGQHDVSQVQAHMGGAAADAASSIGAEAYATGNAVAFKAQPSLHLAAHEAAHVVQQRGGVQLKGGVGEAGDTHEQHADAVADLVVQGKSAEGLLNRYAGDQASPGLQLNGDPKEAWNTQRLKTALTFVDLVLANKTAAESWVDRAAGEEPPPLWKSALVGVGTLVLNAALGGVGGALASSLTKEVTKFATNVAIRTALKAGESVIKSGASAAISAGGSGREAAVKAFCHGQKMALIRSSAEARGAFIDEAGNADEQKLSIADMADVESKNKQLFNKAQEIQNREMLVGWMGLLAGDTSKASTTDSNVEDIDNDGVLRLVVDGAADKPTRVVSAKASGLNPTLRQDLTGMTLGQMRKGNTMADGTRRPSGVDLLITTKSTGNLYGVKDATWARLSKAGKTPGTWSKSGANKAIYFSIFAERTGTTYWKDTDADFANDFAWGADAGRWFLDNVRSGFEIVKDLDNLQLPAVGT